MPQTPKQRGEMFNATREQHGAGASGRTMRAVYLKCKAGTEALVAGEIPPPKAQAGAVLVKVHATAVMPTELEWFERFRT